MEHDQAEVGSRAGTTCPFCGTETGLERDVGRALGSLPLTELETLVRNEWRGRLGPDAYPRPHRTVLVRVLIAYALNPRQPDLEAGVDDALWQEVALLESWGLNRDRMWEELVRLSQAMWDVLCRTGLEFDRTRSLMELMDRKIHETLGWPERDRPPEDFLT